MLFHFLFISYVANIIQQYIYVHLKQKNNNGK